MDIFLQNFLISMTVAIPAVMGVARYRVIDREFYPVAWICCLLTLNEIVMFILIRRHHFTYMSYNIVLPVACTFFLILFSRWGLFTGKKYAFAALLFFAWGLWIADHFLIHGYRLNIRTYYFRVFYSLTLVLLSVTTINRLIVQEKKNLLQNSRFLIAISLVVYFTYRIIVDAFNLKGMSQEFLSLLGNFNRYLLVTLNIMFALAILWMPLKKNYTLQF